MKNIIHAAICLSFTLLSTIAMAQGIYFEPSPTDVTGNVRIYVDITSSECDCPNVSPASADDPLYIWTWNPNEARPDLFGENVQNGEWGNSNDNLVMTQDETNPNLWYFDFLGASPVQFYDRPAADFYANGISFLVKKKNGNGDPEPKSPDFTIIPEPVGCVEIICPFPTVFFDDEYAVFTYDNASEDNPLLQNMAPGEAIISFRYRVNGGPLQTAAAAPGQEADFTMDYEGEGFFSFALLPRDFLGLQEGENVTQITVRVNKIGVTQPRVSAPFELGCPE